MEEFKKILLADDEDDIREILDIVLTDMGYEVITAKDGEEAIALFKKEVPPIVLTDIKMPGIDGIEVLKTVKAEYPDTEVIMITGHGDMELAIKSLKYEASDFIQKPINDDILEIALKQAVERLTLKYQLKMYTENLEKLVEEKTRRLIESERMAAVGQTAAGLAHAIKNITGGLAGGMYVLDKGFELNNKDYLQKGWEMVKGNVNKINNLSLDLLNFAKEKESDYKECNPNLPAKEVYDLMKARAEEYGIEFVFEPDQGLPPVMMDQGKIHRVLLNLVTNSIYACTLPGCSGQRIVMRTKNHKNKAVIYEVEDNGYGMDENTKKKLFKTFFSTKGYDGTGLGLMISKKLIEDHKGEIRVKSEKGKGTNFSIYIPFKTL